MGKKRVKGTGRARKVGNSVNGGRVQKVRKDQGIPHIDDEIPGAPKLRSCRRSHLKKAGVYEEYLRWVAQGKTYDDFQKMRAERGGNRRYLKTETGTIDDGIPGERNSRSAKRCRLKKAGLYEEYREWHKQGNSYEDFQAMRAKREGNYRYLSSKAKTDGKTRQQRRYARIKDNSDEMVAKGYQPEDTPLGKMNARSAASAKKPKQCKLCPLVCPNYLALKAHVERAHSAQLINLVARLQGQERDDALLIANQLDGDLQWKIDHYMKVTGSNVGQFVRWTGRGKDSSLTNALIDRPRFNTKATAHGIKWEKEAIRQYARIYDIPGVVAENRQFQHPSVAFISATTDGLIGEEGLVEVKCPSSTIEEMLRSRSGRYLHYRMEGRQKVVRLKRNSDYYYQVVLQLVCSGRAYLDFVVAYRDNEMVTAVEDDRWTLWKERIFAAEAASEWEAIMAKIATSYDHAASLITIPDAGKKSANAGEH